MLLEEPRADKKKFDFLRDIPGAESKKGPFNLLVAALWDSSSLVCRDDDTTGTVLGGLSFSLLKRRIICELWILRLPSCFLGFDALGAP